MGILTWIIFGALAGWIASLIMKTNGEQGAFMNIVVGIVGAIIGGWLMSLVNGAAVTGFNLYSMLVAVLGACVLLFFVKVLLR